MPLSHAEMRRLFTEMVEAFGRKEFDRFESYMTADAVYEWPYKPTPDWPHTMVGTRQFRQTTEAGMAAFEPLRHQVDRIYDMAEPDTLIAEYHSDTVFPANGRRYSNQYLGIVRFSGDKISYWKEYINPLTVQEVMQG